MIQTDAVSITLHMNSTRRLTLVCLALDPKVRGFKPGRGDGLLGAMKIRSTPSFGEEAKPEVPCR
jgi:hypothetical protein